MPISPLPQAPYRQDRKNHVTPIVGDVLFSEVRDCNRIDFPEYGTMHPNEEKWPYHKLVFIKPVDIERNDIFEFFYAADRDNQDLYNFEYSDKTITGVAGRKLRTVERTYVTLRSEFDAEVPVFNAVMPDQPAGQFDAIYYFLEKQQARVPDKELDSLYIVEKHVYVDEALLTKPTSLTTEKGDLTPAKFRFNLPTSTTDYVVEGDVAQPVLTGEELASTEEQLSPYIKEVRTVSRTAQTADISFSGQRAYVEGTQAQTTETLSLTEPAPETGLYVVESQVSPLGDGRFTKETVQVTSWPTLLNAEWDHTLKGQIKTETTFVAPTDVPALDSDFVSYKAVNKDRTLKSTEEVPTEVLDGYLMSTPSRIDLHLPRILKDVKVVWSSTQGQGGGSTTESAQAYGSRYSITSNSSGSSSSSASVKPSLLVTLEEPWGWDLPATVYYFYLYSPSGLLNEADICARIGDLIGETVEIWPNFKPQQKTLVATGVSNDMTSTFSSNKTRGATAQSQSIELGSSSTYSNKVGLDVDDVTIPPTLHSLINIGVYDPLENSNLTKSLTPYTSYSVRQSNGQRFKFSADFDGSVNQYLTLYPSGALFQLSKTILDATTFVGDARNGVHVIDQGNGLPQSEFIYYFNGLVETYAGDKVELKNSGGTVIHTFYTGTGSQNTVVYANKTTPAAPNPSTFTIANVTSVVVTPMPSGTPTTYAIGLNERIVPDTSVVVSAGTSPSGFGRYQFDFDFSASLNAGDNVKLYDSSSTLIHEFVCLSSSTDTSSLALATDGVSVSSIISGAPTIACISVVINDAAPITATYVGAIEVAIATNYVASEITYTTTTYPNTQGSQIVGKVEPTSLAATSPSDIPRSGLYITQSQVEPYKWNWIKCKAVVLDATQFAAV